MPTESTTQSGPGSAGPRRPGWRSRRAGWAALALPFVAIIGLTESASASPPTRASSTATTTAGPPLPPAPPGASCVIETQEVERPAGADGSYRVQFRANCASLPAGVQVGAEFLTDRGYGTPVRSTEDSWLPVGQLTTPWHSNTYVFYDSWRVAAVPEYRADPGGSGSACTARIDGKNVPLGYDEHRVIANCAVIASAVQVRGVADFTAQADKETAWFTTTGQDVASDYQTRSVPAMPTARLEYQLR